MGLHVAGMRLLRLQDNNEYPVAVLQPLVERLRLPGANAWSLNVVFSQPKGVHRAGCAPHSLLFGSSDL